MTDEQAQQEARWAAQREECYGRFTQIVLAAQRGNYSPGHRLIQKIRQESGDKTADIAAKELRAATGYTGKKK